MSGPRRRPSRGATAPPPDAPGAPARRAALDALLRIERDGAYAHLALPAVFDRHPLDDRDRRLVTELVAGTTRQRRRLDHRLEPWLLREPDDEGRCLLRLGAYQLDVMGVPPHAAVAATVGAAPRRLAGFVNAVLRKVASAPAPPTWPSPGVELSYPDWIVDRFVADLGHDDAIAALVAMNEPPTTEARADGWVQDRSSQRVVAEVDAGPGLVVLDVCAAPGGKATALAAGGATVVAAERRAGRARALARGVRSATGSGPAAGRVAGVVVADAAHPPFRVGAAARVLVDAPCSGLGSLRHRPDARWRVDADAVGRLADLQVELVRGAAAAVAPGGLLVYSVCTVTAAETSGVADRLAADDVVGAWPVEPPVASGWRPCGRGSLVLPQDEGGDGMFVLRLRRPGPMAPAPA